MSNPTRRGFLKGLGATLAAVGVSAVSTSTDGPAPVHHSVTASTSGDFVPAFGMGRRRMNIRPDQLEMLVVEQISQLVGGGHQFTAYDVTQQLRKAHPNVNIMHHAVRAIVHQRMQALVVSQYYDQHTVQFGTGPALYYLPL